MSEDALSDPVDEKQEKTSSSNDGDLSKLMSSATLVIIGQILYTTATLGERAIITNALSPSAYGQVGIGLSVLTVGTTLGLFGFESGVSRYLSRFSDETERRGVVVTGASVGLVGTLVISVVLYLNLDLIASLVLDEGDNTYLLSLFVIAIPIVGMMKIGVALIRGMENTIYRTYAKQIVYPGSRLVFLIGLLGLGWGIAAAGYAYIASAAIAAVVALLLFARLFSIRGSFRTHYREMLTYSAPLVFAGFATTLLAKSDTLMVGYFKSNAAAGFYEAAYPLATGLSMFLSAFGFLYFPLVSRLDSEDRTDEVDQMYKLTTKWVYLLTFPVFLLLFVFPDDVLRIVFGAEYEPAALALSILAAGFFSHATTGRCTETLSAFGKTRAIFAINTTSFLFNVGLNLVLIPRYSFVGAAISSGAAYVFLNVAAVAVLWRWFGVSPFSSASVRTMVVLPLVLIPPFLLAARVVSLSVLSLGLLIALVPTLTLAVYFGAGCVEPEDRLAVDLVEGKLGRSVPLADRFIPSKEE